MRVLLIATRPPYGQMTGHKLVLRTYVRALQGLGHRVFVACFAIPGDPIAPQDEDLDAPTRYLPLPSKWAIGCNIVTNAVVGSLSLNECLYASPRVGLDLAAIAQDFSIDFVVADMIRTAHYAVQLGLPWMLDHDDLLSERYALWANRSSGNESILGYLEPSIPSVARAPARWIFRKMLRRESRILATNEVLWSNRTFVSSLRTSGETERLQQRTKGHVFMMPVTVSIPPTPANALDVRPMTAVFTGALTYQPNLDALRVYVRQIIPEFEKRAIEVPVLKVIGDAPDSLRDGLRHPRIRFLGYVPDVNEKIRKAQVFFAPIVSGSGIKIKILEALACGLPIIGYPAAMVGVNGEPGRDYLRADDAAAFVEHYQRLRDDVMLMRRIGDAARQLSIKYHSLDASMRVLGAELARLPIGTAAGLQRDDKQNGLGRKI